MEVLASRLILHPSDMAQSRHFYEQVLGLRIIHEYGDDSAVIGVVYFLGAASSNCPAPPQAGRTGSRRSGSRCRMSAGRRCACAASAFLSGGRPLARPGA
jgi:catechol 2,3-dioxygenase-like lactoylglutathione lyase family enzyme